MNLRTKNEELTKLESTLFNLMKMNDWRPVTLAEWALERYPDSMTEFKSEGIGKVRMRSHRLAEYCYKKGILVYGVFKEIRDKKAGTKKKNHRELSHWGIVKPGADRNDRSFSLFLEYIAWKRNNTKGKYRNVAGPLYVAADQGYITHEEVKKMLEQFDGENDEAKEAV